MTDNDNDKLQHVFTWEIKNFSMNAYAENEELQSPVFKAENIAENAFWYIKLYPRGYENEYAGEYASCFLVRCEDNTKVGKIFCEYSMEIISSSGKAVYSMADKCVFTSGFSGGFQNFVDMKLLSNYPDCLPEDTLTLRCHMKGRAAMDPKISRNFAETKIGFDRIILQWRIKVFQSSNEKFTFRLGEAALYELSFFIPDDSLSIEQKNKTNPATKAELKVSLVDRNGGESEPTRFAHFFKRGECLWTIQNFMSEMDRVVKYRNYVWDSVLILNCVFSASNSTQSRSTAEYQYCPTMCENAPSDVDTVRALEEDLKSMFANRVFTDVTLRLGGHIFKAHKAILSVRSGWFAEKFENNDVSEVTLSSIEPAHLNMLLEYVYTGSIAELDSYSAGCLMSTAEEYKMTSFYKYCEKFGSNCIAAGDVSGFPNSNYK